MNNFQITEASFRRNRLREIGNKHIDDLSTWTRLDAKVAKKLVKNKGILWDRDIPRLPPRDIEDDIPGIYIWYENHHNEDTCIYIGESGNIFTRLYQEYRIPTGNIYQYTERRMSNVFIPCEDYCNWQDTGRFDGCDCIPRLWVKIKFCRTKRDRLELEKYIISQMMPLLNIAHNSRNNNAATI